MLMDAGSAHPNNTASPYNVAFIAMHLGCFAVFWTGVSSGALLLGLALYWIRIFAIGATLPTAHSERVGSFSLDWPFCLRRPPSAAFCGGRPSTASGLIGTRMRRWRRSR
jgi:hypothetical protein